MAEVWDKASGLSLHWRGWGMTADPHSYLKMAKAWDAAAEGKLRIQVRIQVGLIDHTSKRGANVIAMGTSF